MRQKARRTSRTKASWRTVTSIEGGAAAVALGLGDAVAAATGATEDGPYASEALSARARDPVEVAAASGDETAAALLSGASDVALGARASVASVGEGTWTAGWRRCLAKRGSCVATTSAARLERATSLVRKDGMAMASAGAGAERCRRKASGGGEEGSSGPAVGAGRRAKVARDGSSLLQVRMVREGQRELTRELASGRTHLGCREEKVARGRGRGRRERGERPLGSHKGVEQPRLDGPAPARNKSYYTPIRSCTYKLEDERAERKEGTRMRRIFSTTTTTEEVRDERQQHGQCESRQDGEDL